MKTNMNIRTALFATAVTVLTLVSGTVFAQTLSSQPVAESQKMSIRTSFRSQATNYDAPSLSSKQVQQLARTSLSASLMEQVGGLSTVAKNLTQSNVHTSIRELLQGNAQTFAAQLTTNSVRSVATSHSMKVHVEYQARPIGGVLSVRVELAPQFSGVGVCNRPIASKSIMTAVDDLNEGVVNGLVASLSQQLTAEVMHNAN